LSPVVAEAAAAYAAHGLPGAQPPDDLLGFVAERLKVALKDRGVRHDRIAAAFACPRPDGGQEDDLVRLCARVDALSALLDGPDGADLLAGYRRAANILGQAPVDDALAIDDPAPQSAALRAALENRRAQVDDALREEDFFAAMKALAGLRGPVDGFFDGVMVNADDAGLRAARIALLRGLIDVFARVASFSLLEG
ncbi:MAG: glycine--tRNA ligase subunit beta, partial [Pseudomonadota bacterium]